MSKDKEFDPSIYFVKGEGLSDAEFNRIMSKDNREVKTDLYNILSHVSAAEDYGYYHSVLMSDFADMTGYVTDEEIEKYINDSKSEEYTQEDYDSWRDRIVGWRDRYCKDTGEVTIDSGADVCEWKPKLRAFLEGLQMSNIDGLMNCTKEEFRNVGEIMAQNIISKTNNY